MATDPLSDATVERFVLGRLDDEGLAQVETWLIAEPQAADIVDATELELAERYLDDELDAGERADFERALASLPRLAYRLTVVRLLRDVARRASGPAAPVAPVVPAAPVVPMALLTGTRTPPWWQASWVPATLAASLVAAVTGSGWLARDRERLASELQHARAAQATMTRPSPDARPTVVDQASSRLQDELQHLRAALAERGQVGAHELRLAETMRQATAAAAVSSVTLSAGVTRSGGAMPRLRVTPLTRLLQVRLRVPRPAGETYRAVFADGDDHERARLSGVTGVREGPVTVAAVDVAASTLPPGDYSIVLSAGEPETTVATYTVRVVAQP